MPGCPKNAQKIRKNHLFKKMSLRAAQSEMTDEEVSAQHFIYPLIVSSSLSIILNFYVEVLVYIGQNTLKHLNLEYCNEGDGACIVFVDFSGILYCSGGK